MTDLTTVLPAFQINGRLLGALEKSSITTADLISLDPADIAKRTQLAVNVPDVKGLSDAVLEALQNDLKTQKGISDFETISSLDDDLDRALGGGVPTGYITEVTGESGAGKTQFLLTLLLAAQLPPPVGLSCSTLYISTESALPTTRLSQLLRTHPALANLVEPKPTLDAVISIVTPDLESQDHILRYQVPVAIRQYGIRLIILDSVAANYRAEFERAGAGNGQSGGANMAQRSSELMKLGQLLRDLAREHDIAVVVANQVADRFNGESRNSNAGSSNQIPTRPVPSQSSPLARRSTTGGQPLPLPSSPILSLPPKSQPFRSTADPMSLDHQQRWFTGWGDEQYPSYTVAKNQKTPSLGLIWTTQIACRIALIKRPVYGRIQVSDQDTERGEPVLRRWRRWMKVVFAPHVVSSGPGIKDAVEFEITGEGIRAVHKKGKREEMEGDEYEEDEAVAVV